MFNKIKIAKYLSIGFSLLVILYSLYSFSIRFYKGDTIMLSESELILTDVVAVFAIFVLFAVAVSIVIVSISNILRKLKLKL